MIASAVAELQLEGLSSKCQGNKLVTETYAEDRLLANELLDIFNRHQHSRRVSRAVREKYAVRIELQDLLRRVGGRHDGNGTAVSHEAAEDVPFDAEVIRNDVELRLLRLRNKRREANGVPSTSPHSYGAPHVTLVARSRLSMRGTASTFFARLASSRSVLERTPRIAPSVRSILVSIRVSTPGLPRYHVLSASLPGCRMLSGCCRSQNTP